MNTAKIHSIDAGVAAAKRAVANGAGPVVLADHSDRSGYATWLLRAMIEQGLSRALIGTVADAKAIAGLMANNARIGDEVDILVGGLADEFGGPAGADPGPGRGYQRSTAGSEGPLLVPYRVW